jgi:hypothetical protein
MMPAARLAHLVDAAELKIGRDGAGRTRPAVIVATP